MITLQKAHLYWTVHSYVKYNCVLLAIIGRLSCHSDKGDLRVEEYCMCRTLTLFSLANFGMRVPGHNYVHIKTEVDLIRERLAKLTTESLSSNPPARNVKMKPNPLVVFFRNVNKILTLYSNKQLLLKQPTNGSVN